MKLLIYTAFGLAMLGGGCKKISEVGLDFSSDVQVEWYADGRRSGELEYKAQSQQVADLVQILKDIEGRWHADFNSYAPRLIVRSTSANMNVFPAKLIVNLNRNGRNHQYSASVPHELSERIKVLLQP